VGGDFNARTAANGDTTINVEGKELLRFAETNDLKIINFDQSLCNGQFSRERKFGTGVQRSTIDYILMDEDHAHQVQEMKICDEPHYRLGSDHKPLKLDVTWFTAPNSPRNDPSRFRTPTWNVDRCSPEDWENFKDELQKQLDVWRQQHAQLLESGRSDETICTNSTALLELAVKRAAAETIGARYVYPKKYKPWIDAAILSMIHQRDDLLALCKEEMRANGGSSEEALLYREKYQRQCRVVRNAIRSKKREVRARQHAKLEQATGKQVWRQLRSMLDRPRASLEVIRRPDNTLASTHEEKIIEVKSYFERLGKDLKPAGTFDDAFAAQIKSDVSLHEEDSIAHDPHPVLDVKIERKEIRRVLLNLKSGKAAGPDRIPNELLKHGGEALVGALHVLFEHVWKSERWPEQWRSGNIVLLHKKGPAEDLDNYRGITLLPTMSKVFETVLNSRLSYWAESGHKLRDEQGGFRPDRRCADQMFLLHEIIASRRESTLATYCAFIDVRKAYDTVWRDGLWQSLWELDIRGKMYRMLSSMFGSMERRVMLNGKLSAPFPVQLGVAQGAVTSPFLYACFINNLLAELDSSGLGVTVAEVHIACLAYADDIVLVAPSPQKLRALLKLLDEYAKKWRFCFNVAKSNVMVFGTKRQIDDANGEAFELGGEQLLLCEDYKYLGCEASAFMGRSGAVIDRLVHEAKRKGASLSGPGGCRFNGVHASKSLRLWESYARPVLEYGAEIWQPTQVQCRKLESVVCDFARHALGVDRRTGNDLLMSELGLLSLAARRDELRLRFFRHLCLADPERALSKVFRQRCADVMRDNASRSLCNQYRALLLKYDFASVWELRSADQADWEGWQSKTHKAVVHMDLKKRGERLAERVSMDTYLELKPQKRLTRSTYLYGHGLGVWVKLGSRANNLPLLSTLARATDPPMSDHCARCVLCDAEAENVPHFLLRCSALSEEREKLREDLEEAMATLVKNHEGASAFAERVTREMADANEKTRLHLLLATYEEPVKRMKKRMLGSNGRKQAREMEDDDDSNDDENDYELHAELADSVGRRAVDRVVRDYLARLWRKRAALIGGAPMLDRTGVKIVVGNLRPDGRGRTYAGRAPVVQIEIGS